MGTRVADEQSIRYYYLYNAHGDVVRIISGTNQTVKTYDYDAFGNDRNELAADANLFRYCGEYYDTATETYFLRARWYDPATGRFTQQDSWAYYDPDDPLSLNLYLYCYGNPVGYVDPSGHRQKIQLGQGIWSLKNDAQGRYMLYNWLFGRRDDIKVYSWGEYMMSNKGDPRFGIEPLGKQVADIVFPLASELDTGEKIDVNITTQIAIENGEDIIGYQYLHGTNKDAGGFNISGWISKNNAGDTIYALTYTWNDRIDPNFEYASDSAKVELAKKIPGATLNDYNIHIIWKDFSIIRANPKWYLGHSGWLSEYVED